MHATTTRRTETIHAGGRVFEIDVCSDAPHPNPWYVSVDDVTDPGDRFDIASASCGEYSLDECNGETLITYWTQWVQEVYGEKEQEG